MSHPGYMEAQVMADVTEPLSQGRYRSPAAASMAMSRLSHSRATKPRRLHLCLPSSLANHPLVSWTGRGSPPHPPEPRPSPKCPCQCASPGAAGLEGTGLPSLLRGLCHPVAGQLLRQVGTSISFVSLQHPEERLTPSRDLPNTNPRNGH